MALSHHDQLVAVGREIKWALNDTVWADHPSDPRLSGIYGVIWYDDVGVAGDGAPAIVMTEIEGEAFKTAESTFVLDPRDLLGTGFLLR